MNPYQAHATESASGLELTIALYDGMIRFVYAAIDAVDRGDVRQRRIAVKRALDIVMHLQATLRMDVGGKPAQALSEFYVAIFAMMLQASQEASRDKFLRVIHLVKNVRNAWREAANDPAARDVQYANSFRGSETRLPSPPVESDLSAGSAWTA